MTRSRAVWICGFVAVITCATACKKSTPGAGSDDLALLPKESELLFGVNFSRIRSTAMWKKLLDLRDSNEQGKKDLAEFVQKCGLDPFTQLESISVALPPRGVETGDFAVVVRGQFDEAKLVACATEQAKKNGSELKITEYSGRKLYADSQQGKGQATLLDPKTALIGSEAWLKKSIDLIAPKAPGGSAKDNAELMALTKRIKMTDGIWGAGIVPQTMRDQLKNDPSLSVAATMKSVFGSVDFATGLALIVNVETGAEAEAKALAEKLSGQVKDLRQNPQVMMLGMATFLDAVKIESKSTTFTTTFNLAQPQVDDLLGRLQGLLKGFGSALGAGAMPTGMPSAPQAPPPGVVPPIGAPSPMGGAEPMVPKLEAPSLKAPGKPAKK